MAAIPESMNTTAAAIVRWHERPKEEEVRTHLGASLIGHACSRYVWYSWRWATKQTFDGRMQRLFETGHMAEPRFVAELRGIGAEVHDRDPETKKQFRLYACQGHLSGGLDAVARGLPEGPKTWAIVEMKTHNDKSFKKLVAEGVEKSKPLHWAQMQMYMGLAELTRALYIAVNKNDETIHTEWIHFDKTAFEKLLAKAQSIIDSPVPPERLSNDPAWYECKYCYHRDVCHGAKMPLANCRSCVNATPALDGEWRCEDKQLPIPVDVQQTGCSQHLYIPNLIPFPPVDSGKGWVAYDLDGRSIANVVDGLNPYEAGLPSTDEGLNPTSLFSSAELQNIDVALIGDHTLDAIREAFGPVRSATEIPHQPVAESATTGV